MLLIGLSAFAVVMVGMCVLALLCELMRRAGRSRAAAPGTAAASQPDPAVAVVLAAAAAEALGRPLVVHKIRVRAPADAERWSRAGRMDVMVSHRLGARR